jgi:hypothetical protein
MDGARGGIEHKLFGSPVCPISQCDVAGFNFMHLCPRVNLSTGKTPGEMAGQWGQNQFSEGPKGTPAGGTPIPQKSE